MLEDIEKWVALGSIAIGTLWSHFKLIAKVDRISETQKREIEKLQTHQVSVTRDIDELKENRTRNNVLLEKMAESQEETQRDVKLLIKEVTTLVTLQQSRNSDNG